MTNANNTNNGSAFFASTLNSGFKLMDSADKQGTQGTQTLAFSVMIGRAQLIENEEAVADWAAYLTSAKSVTGLMNALLDYADIEKPVMPKGEKLDTILVAQKAYAAHCTALRRAIVFAAELSTMGLDSDNYDTKKKLFAVPAEMLCGFGEETSGRLSKMEKQNLPVLLDGSAYYIERGDSIVSVNASVSQIVKAAKSIRAGGNTETGDNAGTVTAPDNRANAGQGKVAGNAEGDFDSCVIEASKIIKSDDMPVKWSDLDDKTRNALETLRMFIEQAKALDVIENAKAA